MAKRVSFSGEHLGLPEIAAHHQDLESSLRLYFSAASPSYPVRFNRYAATRVAHELRERLKEVDLTSTLTVLASVEAAFRIDYLQRCYRRERDPISRAFREIYKVRQRYVSLEDEIFEVWVDSSTVPRSVISKLRGAFKFRHWLAHGRYLTRKSDLYGFNDVYALADLTLRSFPFYEFGG
jgi:hypothetical protein